MLVVNFKVLAPSNPSTLASKSNSIKSRI